MHYLLFLISGFLFSQSMTASINGFIRDDATGEPISYANVFLSDSPLGAATNSDGYFVITGIPVITKYPSLFVAAPNGESLRNTLA